MGILFNMSPLCSLISLILLGYSCNQALAGECVTVSFNKNDCKFPFTYNEEQYHDCTKVDNWGVPWCSTDPSGDGDCTDCTWANCQESKECVFPTTYKGKEYNQCTFIDNDGYPWCNTTDGGWGNCDRSLCEVEKNELGYWQKDLSDPDNWILQDFYQTKTR